MYFKIATVIVSLLIALIGNTNTVLAQDEQYPALLGQGLRSLRQTTAQDLIKVEKIEIEGNTVFSDSQLKKVIGSIEEKLITLERLSQIRNQIEQFYIDRGYIGSNVFTPPQKIRDGTLRLRIIEGSLSLIEIEGNSNLKEEYMKARLPELDRPIRDSDLIKALTQLKKDPLIKSIRGELDTIEPGKLLLTVEVEENKPIQTQLNFANTYSPTIGSLGGTATIIHQNLLGFGDRASVNYTITEGINRYGVGYSIPFNKSGGRVTFDYVNADSELIEEVISAFDIQADYEGLKLSIQQPIINNEIEEFVFSIGLDKLRSETFVAENISFPFVDGLEDGVSRITPLRIGQEYTRRGNKNLLAAKSQFNIGLDLFNATFNETGIDGAFWSWLGSVQWIRAFDKDGNWQLRTSLTTQLTPDKLLPLEQLTVGGLGSVRGYRQNLIVGDNGIVAVAEGQIPVIKTNKWGSLYLVPFLDLGTIWSNYSDSADNQTNTLASVGLEMNYQIEQFLSTKVFYGIPLSNTKDFGDASAEKRWGFSISVIPFKF